MIKAARLKLAVRVDAASYPTPGESRGAGAVLQGLRMAGACRVCLAGVWLRCGMLQASINAQAKPAALRSSPSKTLSLWRLPPLCRPASGGQCDTAQDGVPRP